MALGLLITGCELEADKYSEELPTRNVGTTFKLFVDDVGPYQETDESGAKTERWGYFFDADHNYFDGENDENVKDGFYQLSRPTAGIIALRFGDDGYGAGGLPIAMTRLKAKKVHYEIPLESITHWVKEDNTIGYKPGQYLDEANFLVYFNRVTGEEFEAALTGENREYGFDFVGLGTVDASSGKGTKSADTSFDSDQSYEDEGDYEPYRIGDPDANCSRYNKICDIESKCNFFEGVWDKTDCKQRLFSYYKHNGRAGSDYINCLRDCSDSDDCSEFKTCKERCLERDLADENGCGGSYGPDVLDVFFVRERKGEISFEEEGVTLTDDDRLAVFVEYADVEGNMAGGKMIVTVNGADTEFDLPNGVHKSSLKEGIFLGFTFENPIPEGRVDFSIALVDGELNGKYCHKEGDVIYDGYFTVNNPTGDADNSEIEFAPRPLQFYEVYSPGIDKYNIGTGFIDTITIDRQYFYELEGFDIGIIQGYIWSLTGIHNMGDLSMNDLNGLIFTTPQDDRNTKYNDTDDITSYAFYIDQPMAAGLYSFWGDTGWNLYPKAPYGNNDDQPFIRGDFETTEIYLPMTPYYSIDLDYTGCGDSCEFYIDLVYGALQMRLDFFNNADIEDERAYALADCKSDFRDNYWSCRVDCLNLADMGLNGCISTEDCMDSCPSSPTQKQESWCDGNTIREIPLKLRLNIDPAFLKNCVYLKALYGPPISMGGTNDEAAHCEWAQDEPRNWEPIKIGVWFNGGLPGAYAEVKPGRTSDYLIHLPFGPKMPASFLSGTADGMVQAQFYFAAFTDANLFATGYYSPDENNDENWAWLLIYGYNWVSSSMQGWSLGTVAGNSITGFVNIFEPIIELNFGDLGALDEDPLDPNATEL